MKYFLFFLATILSYSAISQPVFCPPPPEIKLIDVTTGDTIFNHLDTIKCGHTCKELKAIIDPSLIVGTTTYAVSSVTYAASSFTGGSDVMNGAGTLAATADDGFGDLLPIPFTFCFFGNAYNACVVGSNGNITFNAGLANSGDPWPISGPLPGSNCAATFNCIMAPWNDLYPLAGGTIKYAVYGVAPCRTFVVSWNTNQLYNTGTCPGQNGTQQIVLYETSNVIDIYIHHRAPCTAWNSGFAVTGIENNAGTTFYCPPGENGTTFSATDEGWRFTPTAPPAWAFTWFDSTGAAIGSSDTITLCPTVTSRFSVQASSPTTCKILRDSVKLVKETGPSIDSVTFGNPTSCINNDGYIRFHGIPPGDTIIVTYTDNGVPVGPITRYVDADSNILFSNLFSGVYDLFYFRHDSCLLGPFGPITLVAPPIHISHESFTNPDLCGRCNGSITLYGLLPALPVTVTYDRDGVAQPPYVGVVGLDSTVHLNGLCGGLYASNYTNIVATIGSCSANGPDAVITNPSPVPASFTYTERLHCTGDEVVLTNTSTPSGYSAYWDFGDGSPIDSSGANPLSHIYADAATFTGSYTMKLVYSTYHTCFDSTTQPVNFDHHMLDSFVFAYPAVCLGTEDGFLNYSTSMNSLKYLWDFGDGFSDTSMSPSHTYSELGGIFPVTLKITDTIGCVKTLTQNLEVISVDVRTAVHDTSVCLRDSMWLQSAIRVLPDTVNFISVWTPNVSIGEDSATNNTGHSTKFFGIGTFNYTITAVTYPPLLANPAGCNGSDTERIVSYPPVTMTNLTPSPTVIAYGSTVQLNAAGAVYYTWKPDDGTLSNNNISDPIAAPVDSTTIYTVYGMNLYGCLDSGQVVVTVDYDMSEGIPSAFSPNGDGLNDVFRLTKLKYQKLVDFSVYNRWGQQVFKTTNPEKGWDGTYNGTPQDIGVYNYLIIVARPDGTNKTYSGNVTLIR